MKDTEYEIIRLKYMGKMHEMLKETRHVMNMGDQESEPAYTTTEILDKLNQEFPRVFEAKRELWKLSPHETLKRMRTEVHRECGRLRASGIDAGYRVIEVRAPQVKRTITKREVLEWFHSPKNVDSMSWPEREDVVAHLRIV